MEDGVREPFPDGRNGIIFLPNTGPMDSLTTLHRELILACLDDEPGRARSFEFTSKEFEHKSAEILKFSTETDAVCMLSSINYGYFP